MAALLRTFEERVTDPVGRKYRPRVCGWERDDGLWEGWLEFVPEDGSAVLRSERETTQPNRTGVEYWAGGLTPVYAEGALARTLESVEPVRAPARSRPAYERPAPARR